MTGSDKKLFNNFTYATAVLFLIAFILRLYDLEADPPAYFADGSQGLTTDAAHLTIFARNKVMFGQWDILGFERATAFKWNLITGVSYILFLIGGVTRYTANLTGILLNVGSLGLFLFALSRFWSGRQVLLLAAMAGGSFVLWLYARLPFAENALLFMASLAFVVYVYCFESVRGKILTGVLIGLCSLLGKSFGLLVIFGPLAWIVLSEKNGKVRAIVWLMTGLMATYVGWWILYAISGSGQFLDFIWSHAAGEHGFPDGLSSLTGFVENLIGFTIKSKLHAYAPVVSILAYLSLLGLIIQPLSVLKGDRVTVFMLGWLLGSILFMSPFNYLPLRYLHILIIPISVLGVSTFGKAMLPSSDRFKKLSWARLLFLFLLNWYLVFYLVIYLFTDLGTLKEHYVFVWYVLPLALLLTFVIRTFVQRVAFIRENRFQRGTVVIAVVAFVLVQGWQYSQWHNHRTYGLREANQDVRQLVTGGAVLSGQCGPPLSCEGPLRSLPYFVTRDAGELEDFLARYPVTHLAIGAGDWKSLVQRSPKMTEGRIIGRFWLRDNIVWLVRVSGLPGRSASVRYRLSDYEQALELKRVGLADSASVLLTQFLNSYPLNKTALREQYYLAVSSGKLETAKPLVDTLIEHYDTDFSINMLASIYYKWLGAKRADRTFTELSLYLLDRAIRFNQPNEKNLRLMYDLYEPTARIIG